MSEPYGEIEKYPFYTDLPFSRIFSLGFQEIVFESPKLLLSLGCMVLVWCFFNLRSSLKITRPISSSEDEIEWIGDLPPEATDILDLFTHPQLHIGSTVPTGVLLVGPPGTGKTLFAKTLAHRADCSFFSACASEFDDTYVGVGASRVRQLFDEASAACRPTLIERLNSLVLGKPETTKRAIIFIDEIDSIGNRNHFGPTPSPTAQTITQLLSKMSGMDSDSNILVIAATNHIEALDPALTRSGRFDRIIRIPLPDLKARIALLRYYLPCFSTVSDQSLYNCAQSTNGCSAADMQNLVQEAIRYQTRQMIDLSRTNGSEVVRGNLTEEHLLHAMEAIKKHKQEESKSILNKNWTQGLFDRK